MLKIPDWLVYGLSLGVILWGVFSEPSGDDAPSSLPEAVRGEGSMLPPPSALDDRVLVNVSKPQDGIGTAFAINRRGQWLTARHVVEGCEDVGLLVAPNQYIKAEDVLISKNSDLALILTGWDTHPVALDLGDDLEIGTYGFQVGYPQGRPGETASRLLSRSVLVTNGARQGQETVLAWAETGRTKGLFGTLGGMSGGPVYDVSGHVRGVVVAESPRRGRIYSSSPEALATFLDAQQVDLIGEAPRRFTPSSYGREADMARRKLQVVKVACRVGES